MCPPPSPADPIEDDEGMLRRVPVKMWGPHQSDLPPVAVFLPHKPIAESGHPGDVDGLSLSREAITSAASVSQPPGGKRYHVARLTAATIRAADVSIKPNPQEHDQGHCLLPQMNITNYLRSAENKRWIKERAAMLAQGCTLILTIVSS